MRKASIDNPIRSLYWSDGVLTLLDQTRLPMETVFEPQESIEQIWDSIKQLKVRGAPAIGIAGAYGSLYGLRTSGEDIVPSIRKSADYLNTARPTAVNLSWGLRRMVAKAEANESLPREELLSLLEAEAKAIHNEDRSICHSIGKHGVGLIKDGMGILTHCNAGLLATSELGTATAPIYLAHDMGVNFKVYADETRPLLQGARLTSWELQQAGVDVTLICDNMAASMMSEGAIDLIIVGTDRVAANGDVANKIGTLGVAILARHFGLPFYVACPSSTFDRDTATGSEIVIEERGSEEILCFGERQTGPNGVKTRNPAFDVTPAELVTGFITDRGLITHPFPENLASAFFSK